MIFSLKNLAISLWEITVNTAKPRAVGLRVICGKLMEN